MITSTRAHEHTSTRARTTFQAINRFKRGYTRKTKAFREYEKQGREEKEGIAQISEDYHAANVRSHPGFTSTTLAEEMDGNPAICTRVRVCLAVFAKLQPKKQY